MIKTKIKNFYEKKLTSLDVIRFYCQITQTGSIKGKAYTDYKGYMLLMIISCKNRELFLI